MYKVIVWQLPWIEINEKSYLEHAKRFHQVGKYRTPGEGVYWKHRGRQNEYRSLTHASRIKVKSIPYQMK